MAEKQAIGIEASDVSGQKIARVSNVPTDSTVGELVSSLLSRMQLPKNDTEGKPLSYQALLEREGRHLHASEVVGETLQAKDKLVIQPEIVAGHSA